MRSCGPDVISISQRRLWASIRSRRPQQKNGTAFIPCTRDTRSWLLMYDSDSPENHNQQGTGKAGGIIQFESKSLRIGNTGCPSLETKVTCLLFWFFSSPQRSGWCQFVTKSGVWKLTDQKVIKMWVWCKGKFALFWMPGTPVHSLTLPPPPRPANDNQGARAFIDRRGL